jgi:hypothetical protein
VEKPMGEIGDRTYQQMLGAESEQFAPIYPQEKLNAFRELNCFWAYPRPYYYY